MSPFLRRSLRLTIAVSLAVVTFAGIAVSGVIVTSKQATVPTSASAGRELPSPSVSNPDGQFVVAVALGSSHTIASDFLAPYEVFASSDEFSVYAVAASAAPAQLEGAPAVLPVHTFDQVTAGTAPTPDVVVVPAVTDPTGAGEESLRTFVREQSDRGARILGICNGSVVLAETGLLDGLQATAHWFRISQLEQSRPQVEWVRGQRYVQDGSVTTTAGITSGIPGALKVMADLAGPAEAERVEGALQYPDWSLEGSTDIPTRSLAVADVPIGLNVIAPWLRPTLGVVLSDGDSEIDVTAVFEAYGNSFAARTVAISTGDTVTTRHGLVLLTSAPGSGADIDRIVVPGVALLAEVDADILDWASTRGVTVEAAGKSEDENGFDAALRYLALDTDSATAESAAKLIDYPTGHLALSPGGKDWRASVLVAMTVLLAIGVGFLPAAGRLVVRRLRGPQMKQESTRPGGAFGTEG